MPNPYIKYYKEQAGTGITYQGVRYQRGHGFFGRILSKAIYPLLRFMGKQALGTAANIASDVILDKQNFKESAKKRLNETAEDITKEGVKKVKTFVQDGSGERKRKRSKIVKKVNKKRKNKMEVKKKSIRRKKKPSLNEIEKLFQNAKFTS